MFSSSFPAKAAVEWLIHSYFVSGRFLIPVLAERSTILAENIPRFPQPVTKKKLGDNFGIGYDHFLPHLPLDAT
jgi:hypothetical protein